MTLKHYKGWTKKEVRFFIRCKTRLLPLLLLLQRACVGNVGEGKNENGREELSNFLAFSHLLALLHAPFFPLRKSISPFLFTASKQEEEEEGVEWSLHFPQSRKAAQSVEITGERERQIGRPSKSSRSRERAVKINYELPPSVSVCVPLVVFWREKKRDQVLPLVGGPGSLDARLA